MPPAPQPRQLGLDSPLGPGALTLVELSGHEALSQLFGFTLQLVAPATAQVPFDALVGSPVTVRLAEGRFFNGVVSRLGAGARDARSAWYTAELVPRLWLLTLSRGSRVFQGQTVPEIVERVLDDFGQSARFELQGTYEPRNGCVQYRETALEFVSRLLEEEGIWFTFRHGDGGHELVLGDGPTGPDLGTFPFDPDNAKPDSTRVLAWEKTQELTPGKVTLGDHSFALPDDGLEGTATIPETVQAGRVTHRLTLGGNEGLELYDYPGGYADRFDGADPGDPARLRQAAARDAALRMEAEVARAVVVSGRSTCGAFTPGGRFALTGHPDADGAYLLTRVEHSASQPAGATGAGGFRYANDFGCIPAGVPYRPPRTTAAPVAHPQSAIVVGPPGTQTYTDRFGRVKVQFFWDRKGKHDENSSTWIRVAQPVGGGGAAFWLPEVGDEVLVAFEHGDPDRPYVLGQVFNDDDRPARDDR